jgi:hypothetical protein
VANRGRERRLTGVDAFTASGRRWQSLWAAMRREIAVARPMELADVITSFDVFVWPRLDAV